MKKVCFLTALFLFIFIISSSLNIANAHSSPKPSSTPISTYELFWPLTAGKTVTDNFFFLKRWKEDFRGKVLLGSPAKADYQLLLATKRIIESEKLFDEKDEMSGIKSLELANKNTKNTLSLLVKSKAGGENIPSVKDNMLNRTHNLNEFLPELKDKFGDEGDKIIDSILASIKDIEKLLQE